MASKPVSIFELLGAAEPTKAQMQAIRACGLGTAVEGQQKTAMAYILGELCGLGRSPFIPEADSWTSFRNGSQTVGQAICMIGGADVARFRRVSEDDE